MITMKSLITILCLCFLSALPAFCADYYVSTAGSDSNPGTQAQPFATIQHAIDACPYTGVSSTVHLDGSTWNESPILEATSVGASSMDRPSLVLIGDYNGPNGMGGMDQSIIIGILTLEAINGDASGGCLAQTSYISTSSIHATTENPPGQSCTITIDYCKIFNSTADGIYAQIAGMLDHINITNCIIYSCSSNGVNYTCASSTPNINNCEIYGNYGSGILGVDGQSPFVTCPHLYNNNIHNNYSYGLYLMYPKISFYNNQVMNNSNSGIYITGDNINVDMGGGAQSSPGNNTISGNGTYEIYNESPNNIYAKYNHWDDQSESEMAGGYYNTVDVTRIWDKWEDSSKGYIMWSDPNPTKANAPSIGLLKAAFYPASNSVNKIKGRRLP
jgi:hypothetical protein